MKKTCFLFVLLAIASLAQANFSQNEKELTIKTARALETAPLSSETIKMREKALKWVIETDEVHLTVCGEIFGFFSDKKNKNSSDMTGSYTIGMAAFKLEFADKATDENAAQLAGLNTALKTYEAIIKEKPKNKFDKIDALLAKRDSGQLAAMVNAADCSKK